MARALQPHRARHIVEAPRLLLQVHGAVAGGEVFMVRAAAYVQMPVCLQLSSLGVELDMVGLDDAVAIGGSPHRRRARRRCRSSAARPTRA